MAVNIRSVLVSDAVDPLCVELLKSHGINVVCKYKLSKDQLIQELQVFQRVLSLGASAEKANQFFTCFTSFRIARN